MSRLSLLVGQRGLTCSEPRRVFVVCSRDAEVCYSADAGPLQRTIDGLKLWVASDSRTLHALRVMPCNFTRTERFSLFSTDNTLQHSGMQLHYLHCSVDADVRVQ